LTTDTLGDGVEVIRKYAFNECSSLRGIVIPNAVKSIKEGALGNCSWSTTVILGNELEEIGAWA
jgi:hypothetical protein